MRGNFMFNFDVYLRTRIAAEHSSFCKCGRGCVALFMGKRAVEKPLRGKVQPRDFPTPLGNPATAAGFRTFPTAPTAANLLL